MMCHEYKRVYNCDEVKWLCANWKSNPFNCKIKRSALAVTVYRIWQAQNGVIFENAQVNAMKIMTGVVADVGTNMAAWSDIPMTLENWKLALEWSIPHLCFRKQNVE